MSNLFLNGIKMGLSGFSPVFIYIYILLLLVKAKEKFLGSFAKAPDFVILWTDKVYSRDSILQSQEEEGKANYSFLPGVREIGRDSLGRCKML